MRKFLPLALIFNAFLAKSQEKITHADMSYWQSSTGKNWQVAADVTADLSKKDAMTATAGTGVLLNLPDPNNRNNLLSKNEYGDVDVAFDFMMAKYSNSGFYLQGRYEVQLLDSWGKKNPTSGDCGGIYKRRRFEGEKEILWEGHAPRQNACLAPGLWQRMEISFQAPRFDAAGKKIANAKMLKIVLNGVLIHENVELTGPTGGPISETEAAKGPFMIQGDHGPVAFRNLTVTPFSEKTVKLMPLDYKVWYGKFKEAKEFTEKQPDTEGVSEKLSWDLSKEPNDFAALVKSKVLIPEAGKYKITIQFAGKNTLKINGLDAFPEAFGYTSTQRNATVDLPAGEVPFEFKGFKTDGWLQPILGIWIESDKVRKTPLHDFTSTIAGTPGDPILLEAEKTPVFRSFMDIEKKGLPKKRIVQAVNVGSTSKVHYTYNLENGALAQIWKGDFLNTSPMWDNRGDGSSKPRGAVLILNNTPLVSTEGVEKINNDTVPSNAKFKTLGYDVDENDVPTFRYLAYGAEFEDKIRIAEERYFTRTLSVNTSVPNLVGRLAVAKDIQKISTDTYAVDGKSYYIKLAANTAATIEKAGDMNVLVVPLKEKISYSVMW